MKSLELPDFMRSLDFIYRDASVLSSLIRGKHVAPYIGLVGYENLGDELLYQAHKELFPSHVLEPYRKDTVLVGELARIIGRPFCDHSILGGGTLINDGVWIEKTEHLLRSGSKMFCIGTGVATPGFEARGANDLLSRWVNALNSFEFVGVRGPLSKATLDNAGVKNVIVTGDTALSLTTDDVLPHTSTGVVGLNYGDVAGNPMWGDPARYRKELISTTKELLEEGFAVRLLPVWRDDIPSNESFVAEVNDSRCSLIEVFDSYDAYSRELKKCDFFIGQKLHATIMAFMNGVPSVMIEYRPKCRDFMASLDLDQFIIKTSEFQSKRFWNMFSLLQRDRTSIQAKARHKILEYKKLQLAHSKELAGVLKHA
jgi:polysaccharide pyruvyl transferase WcaK-like protein